MSTTTITNQELLERRNNAVPAGPFNVAPIFIERAKGSEVWDVEGKRYLDFAGGIGVMNVGHAHPRIVEVIHEQTDRLVHSCWHVGMYEPYVRLAERLNDVVPISGPCRTALFNSGAEAVENAIKTARRFTRRPAVVAVERGFHGRTLLGMSLTGKIAPYAKGFGPFAPEIYRLAFEPLFDPPEGAADAEIEAVVRHEMDDLFHYHVDAEEIAGLILEPVLGEGGFYPVHPAAFRALRRICSDHGIVLIADEVQSGFGRCGAMFACERYGVEPDLITMAKSLAGGMPLSALTGRAEIMDAPHVGGIGGTYGGNPVACAAANAVLDVMEEEKLPDRAERIGQRVMMLFDELVASHAHAGRARGLGAMCALEIVDPATGEPDPARTSAIITEARTRGLLLISASGNVIRTLMPLNIPDDQLEEALGILKQAVTAA